MRIERRNHHPVVLCVDDERETLSALRRCLRNEPLEVITAQSAAEALGWFEELPIALVVTDQRMPGGSGADLLRQVRDRSPKTARAILTAYPGPSLMKEGLDAGAERLLYKPWRDEALIEAVRYLLANRSE